MQVQGSMSSVQKLLVVSALEPLRDKASQHSKHTHLFCRTTQQLLHCVETRSEKGVMFCCSCLPEQLVPILALVTADMFAD